MRYFLIVLLLLFGSMPLAMAQLSVGIGFSVPGLSIGINLPAYPELMRVPGYPVYYAPRVRANFFFYDGLFWLYQSDNWYASSWYNGPWGLVAPAAVPVFILRIPVRYYRAPPAHFRGWRADAPPRWDEHWGRDWAQGRGDWNHWQRSAAPPPAPLPNYQRRYTEPRYPQEEQQRSLRDQHYRYQPRDALTRQHDPRRAAPQRSPTPEQRPPQGRAANPHAKPPPGRERP